MPIDASSRSALVPLDRSHLPLIRAWHNTPEIRAATFAFPFPASIEAEAAWYDRNIAAGDGKNAIFGIRSGDRVCGLVMLRNIDWISRSAWFGIFIGDPSARGKGVGAAAMADILDFGFKDLGLNRIALEVAASNAQAIRLYEKLGFEREGLLRKSRFIDGAYVDVWLMSRLASGTL